MENVGKTEEREKKSLGHTLACQPLGSFLFFFFFPSAPQFGGRDCAEGSRGRDPDEEERTAM